MLSTYHISVVELFAILSDDDIFSKYLYACVRNSQKPRCLFTEIHDLSNNLQLFVYHGDADDFIFCELWLLYSATRS